LITISKFSKDQEGHLYLEKLGEYDSQEEAERAAASLLPGDYMLLKKIGTRAWSCALHLEVRGVEENELKGEA
jgi:hypothetical protein